MRLLTVIISTKGARCGIFIFGFQNSARPCPVGISYVCYRVERQCDTLSGSVVASNRRRSSYSVVRLPPDPTPSNKPAGSVVRSLLWIFLDRTKETAEIGDRSQGTEVSPYRIDCRGKYVWCNLDGIYVASFRPIIPPSIVP